MYLDTKQNINKYLSIIDLSLHLGTYTINTNP